MSALTEVMFWVSLVCALAQVVFVGWVHRSAYKRGFERGQEHAEARATLVNHLASLSTAARGPGPRLVLMNPNATMPPAKDRN